MLSEQILKLKSYKAIEQILDGLVLEDFQCVDILKLLHAKVGICIYDTGLGKTLIASALMKMLINQVPSRKFIMIVEKSQLIQTPKKITEMTGLSILKMTAESEDVDVKLFQKNFTKYQILMITKETLNNPVVMSQLYKHKNHYYGIVVDEAHKLSNFVNSKSAFMLRGMLRNFEFRLALTATPITTDVSQLAYLAHMFDWDRFPAVKPLIQMMNNGTSLIEECPDFFINRTRRDLGIISNYRTHLVMVEPHYHQIEDNSPRVTYVTKGPGAENQAYKLRNLILENKPLRGLVYINQHAVRNWVLPFLENAGIKYACINGKTSTSNRAEIMEGFAKGDYDVVITSVTTALDLDCDYIIFYEFCTDIKQMMGRAQRGLNPKTLDLYFIFTRKTREIEYFMKYVYERSLTIQEVLRKDYSELIEAGEKLAANI